MNSRDFVPDEGNDMLKYPEMHSGHRIINQEGIYFITNWMLWIFRAAGEKNKKNKKYQFWQQSNQPKELETNHFMEQKLQYLHNNPVAAGVVSRPEDYVYSSARNYAGETGLLEVEFLE